MKVEAAREFCKPRRKRRPVVSAFPNGKENERIYGSRVI